MEGDHSSDGTEQAQSREVDSNYSDAQLVHLLHHKKASARDPHAVPEAVIPEVYRDVDLHPNAILTALGVDFTRELGDCYHFYSWTRYPSDKAVFRRDRSTRHGRHCWSQGGGMSSIRDGNNASPLIGCKRRFSLVEMLSKKKKSHVKIGPKSYSFKLEELVTAEDEEQEKITTSNKKTPESFLCVYRLLPVIQSKKSRKKFLQPPGPYKVTMPDAQRSPLILGSQSQAPQRASDLESGQALLLDVETPRTGEFSEEPAEETVVLSPVLSEPHLRSKHKSSAEVQGNDSSCLMDQPADPSAELGSRWQLESAVHDPEEWNNPQLIYIPGLEERVPHTFFKKV